MIAYPFRLMQCRLVTDGGRALILVAAERARDFAQKAGVPEDFGVLDIRALHETTFFAGLRKARMPRKEGRAERRRSFLSGSTRRAGASRSDRMPHPLWGSRHFDVAHTELGKRINYRVDDRSQCRRRAALAAGADAEAVRRRRHFAERRL